MNNIVSFYEITFTSKLGAIEYQYVIGNESQVITYAENEAESYGFTFEVTHLNSNSFEENIINLCNN